MAYVELKRIHLKRVYAFHTSSIFSLIHFDQRECVDVCMGAMCLGKSLHVPTSTVSTSLLSHTTSCTGTDRSTLGTEHVCMCACACVRDNSRSAYWQVYVSLFPVLQQHVAFSDTCLSCVCVQERAVPLKKCPTGERWTNSRAANKENWICWHSAPREGKELSVFCEKSQITSGEKE